MFTLQLHLSSFVPCNTSGLCFSQFKRAVALGDNVLGKCSWTTAHASDNCAFSRWLGFFILGIRCSLNGWCFTFFFFHFVEIKVPFQVDIVQFLLFCTSISVRLSVYVMYVTVLIMLIDTNTSGLLFRNIFAWILRYELKSRRLTNTEEYWRIWECLNIAGS